MHISFINFCLINTVDIFAQKFLGQYGYLSSPVSGNDDVAAAIRKFQSLYGLSATGILDAPTVNLMKKPRCGVADADGGVIKKRYKTVKKWTKTHLTYYLGFGQDLPQVSITRFRAVRD